MKRFAMAIGGALVAIMLVTSLFPNVARAAAVVADQIILQMTFLKNGVQAQGAGVLQTGEVNTLTAAVASATRTEVVAAPSAGSIYVRAVLVEKSTGGTGAVTLSYGTGTNCGTGTTVILGPIINPLIGYVRLGILVTAQKALCITTDAATTSARALVN